MSFFRGLHAGAVSRYESINEGGGTYYGLFRPGLQLDDIAFGIGNGHAPEAPGRPFKRFGDQADIFLLQNFISF